MAPQGPLTKLYTEFLANPKKEVLHAQAGLHYVGSTSNSYQSNIAIVGHLQKEGLYYNKKEQKVLSSVESANSIAVEFSNVIEFTNGGGALLPGLDDNFVTDQTVTFPMVHIVQFEDNLIKQIRVYWDQGTLLKNLNVVGKTGKNWPIRFGDEQTKLIKASIADGPGASESAASTRPSSKASNHSNRESLQLFAPREIGDEVSIKPAVIAPRSGIKPPSRELHEIIGEEDDDATLPVAQTPRAGANKAPTRTFFVGQDIDEIHSTPDRKVQVNAKKYKHFALEDDANDDTPKVIAPKRTSIYSKPGASWDFADFVTPDKRPGKVSAHNARNFSWSDDDTETSPVKKPTGKPLPRKGMEASYDIVDETPRKAGSSKDAYIRKSSETHFDLTDDSPAQDEKPAGMPAARKEVVKGMEANWSNTSSPLGEPKPVAGFSGIAVGGNGMGGKKGSGLNWEFEDETPKKQNGAGIKTAGNGMGGRKGTGANWAFEGENDSPTAAPRAGIYKTAGNGMGGKKSTDVHWGFGDGEEEDEEAPKDVPQRAIYKTAGNGMGGKKSTDVHWGFGNGDEEEDEAPNDAQPRPIYRTAGNGMGGKKSTDVHWGFGEDEEEEAPQPTQNRTIYKTAGNGMGGRKGTAANWGFEGEDEEEEQKDGPVKQENAPIKSRAFRKASEPTPDFWDY
ncbi:hypothetical protein AA313_de0207097 [Arthrobotrys entomopaga]|nr:hypothetical protein AA313_de0207097 [Arthrobotrys entomopaga]